MTLKSDYKESYLKNLKRALERQSGKALNPADIDEILSDTEAHFEEALRKGKPLDEVAKALGEPRVLAEGYLAQALAKPPVEKRSISSSSLILFRLMKAIFIVAPLNFFVAVIPFMVTAAMIFAGWVVSISLSVAAGAALFLAPSPDSVLPTAVSNQAFLGLSAILFWTSAVGLGLLGCLTMAKLTEWAGRAVWIWVRWNTRIIIAD
jgi:uncharacterized membrane protein